MIAIAAEDGALIRVLARPAGQVFGFHRLFGFISEEAARERAKSRHRHGLSLRHADWLCRFQVEPGSSNLAYQVKPLEGCQATPQPENGWLLTTPVGMFRLSNEAVIDDARLAETEASRDNNWKISVLAAFLLVLLFFVFPRGAQEEAPPEPEIIEQVTVRVTPPTRQQAVRVPKNLAETLPKVAKQIEKTGGKGAVAQNLGFLGILGQKNLKSALGGVPSKLEDASPGAGAGGKQGSGGELLVGLGQGVKRATVGNSGVAGLGGVGTKGAGGGAGGYGDTMIGSGTGAGIGHGDGRALSALPLSQDIVLEGGLDRAVIQATIAKYLHQVRACYEEGLRRNPGLTGQITMAFEINGTGKLNYSRVNKTTLGDSRVEQCVAGKMMGWQFPKPVGGVDVKVTYPFLLRPVNS